MEHDDNDDDYDYNLLLNNCPELKLIRYLADKEESQEGNYPINRLRNVGLDHVTTSHILVVDSDFVPSQGLVWISLFIRHSSATLTTTSIENWRIRRTREITHWWYRHLNVYRQKTVQQNWNVLSTYRPTLNFFHKLLRNYQLVSHPGNVSSFKAKWMLMVIQLPISMIGSRENGMTTTTVRTTMTQQIFPPPFDLSPVFTQPDTNHMLC